MITTYTYICMYIYRGHKCIRNGSHPFKNKPNKNIKDGDYFDINLSDPPFLFPSPMEIFCEFLKQIGDKILHNILYLYNLLNLCNSEQLKNFVNKNYYEI
jgi:hypothetical protein